MHHSPIFPALGLAAAALLTAGAATPAQALTLQTFFADSQGWSVTEHVRTLGDVNGDLRQDIVGFGDAGVFVALGRSDGTFSTPTLRVRDFGRDQGWRVDQHPRHVADVDGDGRDDLVGFGRAGVLVSYAEADGTFSPARLVLRDFGLDQGWRVDQHPREVVDVGGDGAADIVGFGRSGVHVSHGQSDRTFFGTGLRLADFGQAQGWRVGEHPRTLADMDGTMTADVVGFGDAGTHIAYWSAPGDRFGPSRRDVADFGTRQGWTVGRHARELGRVNGNVVLADDVVGFGEAGVSVAYAQDEGGFTGAAVRLGDFGTAQGWRGDRHVRTLADVNGDGMQDLAGFGDSGVLVAYAEPGDSFGEPVLKVDAFGYDEGWRVGTHVRLFGDVNGDAREDVVAFGKNGVFVALS